MSGIYLHIPFCRKACSYCNFHFSTLLKNKSTVVKAMADEILLRKEFLSDKNLKTIYFGGGTPSILSELELDDLINVIHNHFSVDENTEVTLEVNPEDVTIDKLKSWKKSTINRLSLGVQSFDDEELKWMKRSHTGAQSINSTKIAQQAGFTNISIDLIYGGPILNYEKWRSTLEIVKDLNVQHLSCYNLTAEENTLLGRNILKGKDQKINEEGSAGQFELLMDWSELSGFEQYEISNFSKHGFHSRHNSSYWTGTPYLGIGPSAHSYDGVNRSWNISNNSIYVNGIMSGQLNFSREEISEEIGYHEYMLTRLRTKWGVNTTEIEFRFPKYFAHFKQQLLKEIQCGNVSQIENKVILTRRGKLLADLVTANFFV